MSFLSGLANLFKNPGEQFGIIKNALYETYSRDPAKMMVHTGTVGWTLSSAAQLWNVISSDKFTSNEKKFLIPQEALDALVNITLFYTITNSCKNISSKLVKSGKLLSKELRTYVAEHPVDGLNLGDISTNLSKSYENDPKFFNMYQPFSNGVNMVVNTIACIVASNIVTPYVRNYIGAKEQRHLLSKEKRQLNPLSTPILPAQNRFGIDDYKAQANLHSQRLTSGGSLRI